MSKNLDFTLANQYGYIKLFINVYNLNVFHKEPLKILLSLKKKNVFIQQNLVERYLINVTVI